MNDFYGKFTSFKLTLKVTLLPMKSADTKCPGQVSLKFTVFPIKNKRLLSVSVWLTNCHNPSLDVNHVTGYCLKTGGYIYFDQIAALSYI